MQYQAIEAALADALGADTALIAELKAVFVTSAADHAAAMAAAAGEADWREACHRLQALAASFGAARLQAAAGSAAAARAGDRAAMRRVRAALNAIRRG